MFFEKMVKRRIITFYFKTSTVDVGECIQPQKHWSKQHSKVVTPQGRLLSIIQFLPRCFVGCIICQWSNKLLNFLLSTTYLFHCILFILTLGICTDTQVASSHISCILASFAIFCNVTSPFLITFLLTRKVIEKEFTQDLRGDKFRDLEKRNH